MHLLIASMYAISCNPYEMNLECEQYMIVLPFKHLVSIRGRPTILSQKVLRVAPSARCCCCNYPFFCLDLFLPGGHDPSVCFFRGAAAKIAGLRLFPFSSLRFSHQTKAQHRLDPGYFAPGRSRGGGQWPVGSHHGPGQRNNMGFAPYYMIQVLPC